MLVSGSVQVILYKGVVTKYIHKPPRFSLPSKKHQHRPIKKKKKLFQSLLFPEGLKSVNSEHEILIRKQKNKHSWHHKQTLFSFTEFPHLHGNQSFHYSTETFTHVLNEESSCCTIHTFKEKSKICRLSNLDTS